MAKAIRYGDAQGWGEGWDDDEDRVDAAVYAVAPELLKKNALPPGSRRQATAARSPKGKGCLLPFVFMAVSGMTFVVVFMLR